MVNPLEPLLQSMSYMEIQRNLHISLKKRYMYVAVPKAANSTIKGILQEFELRGSNFKVRNVHDRMDSPLLFPHQLPNGLLSKILYSDKYTRFTCVRNPYTRLLSCFLDRISSKSRTSQQLEKIAGTRAVTDFKSFIGALADIDPRDMNIHYRPQVLLTRPESIKYSHVLKLENFEQDFKKILDILYPKHKKMTLFRNLSPKKTGADEKIMKNYDDKSIDLVQKIYHSDFELFEYSMDINSSSPSESKAV